MKFAIVFVGSLFGLVLLTGIVFYCRPSSPSIIVSYKKYTVAVASTNSNGENVVCGYAVVFCEKGQELYLLTAKHVVDKKKIQHVVIFSNGTQVAVKGIEYPIPNEDIALLKVPLNGISCGKEYLMPLFLMPAAIPQHSSIYVYMDEYYGTKQRTVALTETKKEHSSFYLAGKIEKGRSGSPVFIKDTNQCIGVVSGYFTKESAIGEKTRIVFYGDFKFPSSSMYDKDTEG